MYLKQTKWTKPRKKQKKRHFTNEGSPNEKKNNNNTLIKPKPKYIQNYGQNEGKQKMPLIQIL